MGLVAYHLTSLGTGLDSNRPGLADTLKLSPVPEKWLPQT